MKHIATLFIAFFCTISSTYSMEKEKKINTSGIIPLFNSSDKAGMGHFKEQHERMVNHINGHLLSYAQNSEQYNDQLLRAQEDLRQLRNQCKEKGPEFYLIELIQQHEKHKQSLVTQAVQAVNSAAQTRNHESHIAMERAMTALQKKAELIEELKQTHDKNEMIIPEEFNVDSCDAASSSNSESVED